MRRTSFVRAVSVLSLAFAAHVAAPAYAQGSATATAEHLFNDGLAAMKRGDYAAACEAFAGSNEADASPGTQINLALCNEKQGKIASAWGWYGTAASLATQRGQKERAELARSEAAKLEPRLHKLVITVKVAAEGMVVMRDGVKVPNAVLGREDPIDPGEHVIEVTAPKKKPFKQKLLIAAMPGTDRVEIPPLEDLPSEAGPVGGQAAVVTPPPPATGGGSDGTTQRVIGIITASAGLLCGVPVGIFAAGASSEDAESKKNAQLAAEAAKAGNANLADSYNKSAVSKHDAAVDNQTGAIAFGIGGGVLLIGGIVLILTAPSGSSKTGGAPKPAVRATPLVGSGTYGFGLGGTF
ncbi:MAG: hypothetical protein JST00_08580 [Deltaproteobacteria bacterium]|nr:hypothetical protein [Deltaproteobacteria bacterium]